MSQRMLIIDLNSRVLNRLVAQAEGVRRLVRAGVVRVLARSLETAGADAGLAIISRSTAPSRVARSPGYISDISRLHVETIAQLPLIADTLISMGLSLFCPPELESFDVLGALAKAAPESWRLASADVRCLQFVMAGRTVLDPLQNAWWTRPPEAAQTPPVDYLALRHGREFVVGEWEPLAEPQLLQLLEQGTLDGAMASAWQEPSRLQGAWLREHGETVLRAREACRVAPEAYSLAFPLPWQTSTFAA